MKDGRVRSELRFGRGNRTLLDIHETAKFCDSLYSDQIAISVCWGAWWVKTVALEGGVTDSSAYT
jgi:hypothetical protein